MLIFFNIDLKQPMSLFEQNFTSEITGRNVKNFNQNIICCEF